MEERITVLLVEFLALGKLHNKLNEEFKTQILITKWETDPVEQNKSLKMCEDIVNKIDELSKDREKILSELQALRDELIND